MIQDISTTLLTLTFFPMVVATIFAFLAYFRMGYGRVGTSLCAGYTILVVSLFLGLVNAILGPNDSLRILIGGTRIAGWSLIAASFVYLYADADRNIP